MSDIIAAGGGPTKMAKSLNLAHSTVLGWERVPSHHCMAVSKLTGIALHDLRDDVYPAPSSEEAAA